MMNMVVGDTRRIQRGKNPLYNRTKLKRREEKNEKREMGREHKEKEGWYERESEIDSRFIERELNITSKQ